MYIRTNEKGEIQMKSKLKRVLIVGMAGLMVFGGGISALADDVEVEKPDRSERTMMRKGIDREVLKDKIFNLTEDIQEQLADLKGIREKNRNLVKGIIGIEAGNNQGHVYGSKNTDKFAGKFEEKFEGKLDNLRENHPGMADRLEAKFDDFKGEVSAVREELSAEREAAKEERQARIEELKEEHPDEFEDIEENREELKELRESLEEAVEDGDEDEIRDILDEMMTIIEENKEILEVVSDSEE